MMLTVIVNCGFMTLSKPPAFVENVLEHVFMTIYTLECIVKVCCNNFWFGFRLYCKVGRVFPMVIWSKFAWRSIGTITIGKTHPTLVLYISIIINRMVLIPVKIIARGFFVDQMSYVRDPWNLVDLFVVGLGYIMQIIVLVSPYIMKATQESLF